MSGRRLTIDEDLLVTVCAACLRASCWHGIFYCDHAVGAGTRRMSVRQLNALCREHPSYYSAEEIARVCGGSR